MLTRFKLPLSRGRLVLMVRRPRRRRRLIVAAVVVTVVALLVVAILNSPATPLTCSTPGSTVSAATATRVSYCPTGLGQGL
jgi:hypothetical protein